MDSLKKTYFFLHFMLFRFFDTLFRGNKWNTYRATLAVIIIQSIVLFALLVLGQLAAGREFDSFWLLAAVIIVAALITGMQTENEEMRSRYYHEFLTYARRRRLLTYALTVAVVTVVIVASIKILGVHTGHST